MPSKEYEALVEKVATVLTEQEGCYLQPQDYHRGAAKEVLSTIRAALQEPTEGMLAVPYKYRDLRSIIRDVLAASALGEQSE